MMSSDNRRRLLWTSLVIAMVLPTVVTWIYFVLLHGGDPRIQQVTYGVGKSVQFLLPIAVVAILFRQELKWPRSGHQGIEIGVGFGFLVCGLIVTAYFFTISNQPIEARLIDAASEKVKSMGIATVARFWVVGVFYALVHSFLEEYYWRWFVYGQGRKFWSPGLSGVISSLGFSAHHVLLLGFFFGFDEWRTYAFSLAIGIGGGFWCWWYQRTGNLTAVWVSHGIVDVGIFGLGYWLLMSAGAIG